eukprot:6197156-Pleurochrysis_carterae.AAC.3
MFENDASIERNCPFGLLVPKIRFLANQVLAQLEEIGLVKNIGEAIDHLVARMDEVRLDQAVELALVEVVLPALVVLSLLSGAAVVSLFNSCRVLHEQQGSAAAELGAVGVEGMAKNVAEEGVPLGSNTAG